MPDSVVSVGVDLVDTARFARVIERTPGLVARVFTAREIELSGGERIRPASLAARWAAKEAVAKALVHTDGLEWHHCELLTGQRGEPLLHLTGSVAAAAAGRGITHWAVSLSHDGDMAIAFVVASRGGSDR
ncbi:MAG: holo-ACP synthase [Actinomycetales bacterium]|nr:holo-ACP synthase [Actinomycetales bacterium]